MKVLLAAALLALAAPAWAQSVSITTETLDSTTLITVINGLAEPIDQVRMWLPVDGEPVSFKGQEGWRASMNSAGVVVFGGDAIAPGGQAKFGLIADIAEPTISWKAVGGGADLQVGVIRPPDPAPAVAPPAAPPADPAGPEPAVFASSGVRAVPQGPGPGESVRLVGSGFGASRTLDLSAGGQHVREFLSDASGNFVITYALPAGAAPGALDFAVRGPAGNEAYGSIQVTLPEQKPQPPPLPGLTVSGVPESILRGETFSVTGTAAPGSTLSARVLGPDGSVVTGEPVEVGADGSWSFETVIDFDMAYGEYHAVVTDGNETARVEWTVASADTISVMPVSQRYEPGEAMEFAGTAVPDVRTEFRLNGPRDNEISFSVATPGADGAISFSYPTDRATEEGTYTLFVAQGAETAVARVGLGQLPGNLISVTLDKFNYDTSETLVMSVEAPPSSAVSLLITDPADRAKETDVLNIQSDGRLEHRMGLDGYASGTYTATLSWANSSARAAFSVGLDVGSGPISLSTTKETYVPDEQITVVGDTSNANVLVQLALLDPSGNSVRDSESVTQRTTSANKAGPVRFLDNTLRIPADAEPGTWKVTARSGNNYAETSVQVVPSSERSVSVSVGEIRNTPAGMIVEFHVAGADSTVQGTITAADGAQVASIKLPRTSDGQITQPWIIPPGLEPGTYTITISNGSENASATFDLA